MYWNVSNSTTKPTNINKSYTADLILCFVQIGHLEKLTAWSSRKLSVLLFQVNNSNFFIIRSKSSRERRFELSISGHFNTKAVSTQQFRLTPPTEYQCVPFCDHSEVQAKYRLNIALHLNPQPTAFIVTKYRHTIQLHILSVHTTI